jgi:methanogenic corrinoid protein MtbC1
MELEELKEITKITPKNKIGKLLLFSVFGDCHDIGKNIFGSFARTAGFELVDLGTDVSLYQVMEAIETAKPDIIGMSGMQQETIYEMRAVVCELVSRGIRDDFRVIIGGAVIDEKAAQIVGADFATKDVMTGVEKCRLWMIDKTGMKK